MIRNAGQVDHFSPSAENETPPAFLLRNGFGPDPRRIRIGYVGAIAEWFDADLLRQVAVSHPEFDFHLCGAVTAAEPAELDRIDNITMYGEIPYAEVPAFIRQMDVMVIPFKLLPIIQACDPVKFYEYSSMGKPTVASRMPELKRAEKLVYFADNAEDFGRQVIEAASDGKKSDIRENLRSFAAENSWIERGQQFEEVLANFPLVSIVILAYGDVSWTKGALYSLFDRGQTYPNLEVLIVDNGSTEEALEQLRQEAEAYSCVRVIANGANLGFARGNNVGLKEAKGEYVMLLNNDTYVSPGAIHAMVRDLEDHPEIGVVGPLTNNIGNEAKLMVEYADIAEMKKVARKVTTGYRGVYTPLRVVAYFAVMFRRTDLTSFGLLSEDYGRGMFEDDDHCAVIRSKGKVCALAEDAFVHHHLSGTFAQIDDGERKALFERNKAIYEERWGTWLPHVYRDKRPRSTLESRSGELVKSR